MMRLNKIMKKKTQCFYLLSFVLIAAGLWSCKTKKSKESNKIGKVSISKPLPVEVYLTKADQSVLFTKQATGVSLHTENSYPVIHVKSSEEFQEIDGFGYSLTGGSAMHIHKMSSSARSKVLQELFKTDGEHIGVSYLRISIGASDLDSVPFSYSDLPSGESDVQMNKFSIHKDKKYLIPVLKEILAINPAMKIMGSPWSPPVWMKTNQNSKGGSLRPKYYDAYALYFVNYIQAMAAEGITIDAITVQNEPLHTGNNPSLLMEAPEQAIFVKNHLGPAFEEYDIFTKIIIYDHNADRIDYPISILNDAEANKFIDGSAFHLYGGSIENLSKVHAAHPDKNLYFTEQWVGANQKFEDNLKWHARELIIGATRNWCKTVLEWNLAADSKLEPHTDGGCTECLGALTIDGNKVTKNVAYYSIAHASKFVRPGSRRIGSNNLDDLPNVAFKTPDGEVVVIVLNNTEMQKSFNIDAKNNPITTTLDAGDVATYIWE
jgi:glucosylceramidase